MPFTCRTIEPIHLTRKRRHQFKSNRVFIEFEEVSNHALVGVLMQLSSLTFYAEEIFNGLHLGVSKLQRKCEKIDERISNIQDKVCDSESDDDDFVTPDIDRDRTLEEYLHYQAPNALEEDLFTKDTRNPSIIRLHQKAAQDINYLLRGSQAYAKNRRPKSFDPNVLLDDYVDSSNNVKRNYRNSTFLSSTSQLNSSRVENHSLPTPEEKMKLESSDSMADVIKIDTSGSKYDRQAIARKSLRTGSCSGRQKPATQRMLRQRHKTLSGVPGHPANESGLSHNNTNSGGNVAPYTTVDVVDKSPTAINGHAITPRENLRNAEMQTDDVEVIQLSAAQRRLRSRGSAKSNKYSDHLETPIPVQCPSVNSDSLSQSTDEISRPGSLSVPGSLPTSAFNTPCSNHARTPASPHSDAGVAMAHSKTPTDVSPHRNGDQFMRASEAKRLQQVDDRISSGFWSGTESTRHSSASEILQQHNHVTQALQQILKNPRPLSPPDSAISVSSVVHAEMDEVDGSKLPSWYASSVASSSVNSRLSTLDRSSPSLVRADDDNRYKSSDSSSVISQRIEQALGHPEGRKKKSLSPRNNTFDSTAAVSPRALLKKKKVKGGEYSFMNSVEEDLNKTPLRKSSRFSFRGRKSSKKAKPVESPSSVVLERKIMPAQNVIVAMSECSFRSEDSGSLVPGDSIVNGMSASRAMSVCSVEDGTPLQNSTRNDGCETPTPSEKGFSIQPADVTQQTSTPNYYSYQRAIKTNNEVAKTLTEKVNNSRSDSSSTGTVSPHATTPQTSKKKGPKPPPPKRNSSLSAVSPLPTRKPTLPTVAEDKNTTDSVRAPLSPINGTNFMNELASAIKSSQSVRKNKSSPSDKVIKDDEESSKTAANFTKRSSKFPELAYMEPLRSSNNNNNANIVVETTNVEEVKIEKPTEKKSRPPPPPKPTRTSSIRTPSSGPSTPKKPEPKETSPARKATSPVYFSTAHNWGKIPETTSIRHVGFKANKSPAVHHQSVEVVKTPLSANRQGSDDVFGYSITPKLNTPAVGDDVPDSAKIMKTQQVMEELETEVAQKSVEDKKKVAEEHEVKKKQLPPQVKLKPSITLRNASARAAFFSASFEVEATEENPVVEEEKLTEVDVKVVEEKTTSGAKDVKDEVKKLKESEKMQNESKPTNIKEVFSATKTSSKVEEVALSVEETDNKEVTGSKDDQEELMKENESNMSELLKLESSSPVGTSSRPKSSSLKLNIPSEHRQLSTPVNASSAVARLLGNTSSLRKSTSYGRSKSLNSPPISPGIKEGLSSPGNSPMSTLERRKNKRLTGTVGRPSTRTTSRDDFKNLLLQSATRTTPEERMTAAEKLLLTKNRPQSAVMSSSTMPRIGKTSSLEIAKDNHTPLTPRNGIASISDIRSLRVGRSYKKTSPKSSLTDGLNGKASALLSLGLHGNQPPVSMSGKFNSKRSRTPTRLMMSISEDKELEKSPETTARAESD